MWLGENRKWKNWAKRFWNGVAVFGAAVFVFVFLTTLIGFGSGKPVFLYNFLDLERFKWSGPSLGEGKHTIVFDFKYDGPSPAKGGTGVLSVDGKEVDRKTIPHTIPILMTIDESFDIGADTRTGVDDREYRLPFNFTGTIDTLNYKLGPDQMLPAEKQAAAQAVQEKVNN
jgi:arylsulfatase